MCIGSGCRWQEQIPFVESYFGSVIGLVAGVAPPLAVAAAIVGITATMTVMVLGAHVVRGTVVSEPKKLSGRRRRLRQAFDKYGVPG